MSIKTVFSNIFQGVLSASGRLSGPPQTQQAAGQHGSSQSSYRAGGGKPTDAQTLFDQNAFPGLQTLMAAVPEGPEKQAIVNDFANRTLTDAKFCDALRKSDFAVHSLSSVSDPMSEVQGIMSSLKAHVPVTNESVLSARYFQTQAG